MKQTTITTSNAGQRADKFVRKWLNEAPLSFIYRLFRLKDVKVNGHWIKIEHILAAGEILTIYVTEAQLAEFAKPRPIVAAPFPHQIIYEDDVCLIVNKPKGLLVHGDASETRVTLTNQVLAYLATMNTPALDEPGFMPAPTHRLDRNTSGLVIFAKTLPAQQALEKLFHDRTAIGKTYLALVDGHLEGTGVIEHNLRKDAAKNLVTIARKGTGMTAVTEYKALSHVGNCTLVEVNIKTGRTHQIRVHMQAIGHPLVGDRKYGSFSANRAVLKQNSYENQFLHAHKLIFGTLPEPIAHLSQRTFTANLPLAEHNLLLALEGEGTGG